MTSAVDIAVQYWLQALAQPFGLGLTVSSPIRAKTQLYAAKKKLEERGTDLSNFTIRTSPRAPATELFILRDHRSPAT